MTTLALSLILVAAFLHATWNYCAKRASGGLPFVWVANVIICACYVPAIAIYHFWKHPVMPAGAAPFWLIELYGTAAASSTAWNAGILVSPNDMGLLLIDLG